jgi:hypothetical protein
VGAVDVVGAVVEFVVADGDDACKFCAAEETWTWVPP